MSKLLTVFLSIQQQIRLYHWKTMSYSRHIASGQLYTSIDTLIDKFIETFQGKMDGKRIDYETISITLYSVNDNEMINILKDFKEFLVSDVEKIVKGMSNTDLKNIRDEILAQVNQTLYLFSLQ